MTKYQIVGMPKRHEMKDSRLRSILKSLSWRITATIATVVIAYFITGDTSIALKIGAIV